MTVPSVQQSQQRCISYSSRARSSSRSRNHTPRASPSPTLHHFHPVQARPRLCICTFSMTFYLYLYLSLYPCLYRILSDLEKIVFGPGPPMDQVVVIKIDLKIDRVCCIHFAAFPIKLLAQLATCRIGRINNCNSCGFQNM